MRAVRIASRITSRSIRSSAPSMGRSLLPVDVSALAVTADKTKWTPVSLAEIKKWCPRKDSNLRHAV